MRCILLINQNTEVWNGFSQKDKDVFMHAAGDIVEELSATGERVGGEGRSTPRRRDRRAPADAPHRGMEIRALMHGGGEEV
jgi:hypothetical protein